MARPGKLTPRRLLGRRSVSCRGTIPTPILGQFIVRSDTSLPKPCGKMKYVTIGFNRNGYAIVLWMETRMSRCASSQTSRSRIAGMVYR